MPINPLKQALTLLRRRYHARRIGVNFKRCQGWKAPSSIRIDGRMRPILAPNEPGSDFAFLDIFIDDCYGIRRVNPPIERIIDIGGHSGFFSLHAKMLYPKAAVHSYEPNPAMSQYIDYQSKTGGFQWFPEAVGETDGRVNLAPHKDSVCSRTIDEPAGSIPMLAFSKALQRVGGCVDFLKLDCEGAEWSIFRDSKSMQSVRQLGMEYHLFVGHTREELISTVTALGFKIMLLEADGPDYGRLWAQR